jgi:hypothetical protein
MRGYYRWSPLAVKALDRLPMRVRILLGDGLDRLARVLRG